MTSSVFAPRAQGGCQMIYLRWQRYIIRLAPFWRRIKFWLFIRNIAEAAVSRINPRDLVTHLMSSQTCQLHNSLARKMLDEMRDIGNIRPSLLSSRRKCSRSSSCWLTGETTRWSLIVTRAPNGMRHVSFIKAATTRSHSSSQNRKEFPSQDFDLAVILR